MPKRFKTYYEPFIGGGALFFAIQPKSAVINDSNIELANLYRTIRTKKPFKALINTLDSRELNHSEDYYYNLRNIDKNQEEYNKLTRYEKSARTLYMNKACFNGLYRVNSKGEFNTNKLDNLVLVKETGGANKTFDFAVLSPTGKIYLIEVNFYSSGGSKLNETARSYTRLQEEINKLDGVEFVWITDGTGWKTAKNNLHEAYQTIDNLITLEELDINLKEIIK